MSFGTFREMWETTAEVLQNAKCSLTGALKITTESEGATRNGRSYSAFTEFTVNADSQKLLQFKTPSFTDGLIMMKETYLITEGTDVRLSVFENPDAITDGTTLVAPTNHNRNPNEQKENKGLLYSDPSGITLGDAEEIVRFPIFGDTKGGSIISKGSTPKLGIEYELNENTDYVLQIDNNDTSNSIVCFIWLYWLELEE